MLISSQLMAQQPDVDSLRAQYKDESAVYSVLKESMTIKIVKEQTQVSSNHESEMWFLKDNAHSYADRSIYFSYFTGINNINAYTLVPGEKKGKYSKEYVSQVEENNTISAGIFYDSGKRKSFVYPNTKKDGAAHLEYTEVYNDPHFLGLFYFSTYVPIQHSEFSISFPSNVKVEYTLVNTEKYNIKFTTSEKKGITTYTWQTENIAAYEHYSNSPSLSYYVPHVVVRIAEVKHKNGTVESILPDVKGLYNWYYGMVQEVNQDENVELKSLVDSIVKDAPNSDEKARRIFNWVQSNVKYVAFEDGMGGFVPREAFMVCQKRYGDCKDMASIITEMLRYAGLKSHLTWIGSRDIPYAYDQVPTPLVDNHMISAYERENGEIVFLDATGYYTPFGMPTSFIQGKEALISNGKGKFKVMAVPVIGKEKNLRSDSLILTLEGDALLGKGLIDSRGYDKIYFVNRLLNETPDKRKEKTKAMLDKGNNKIDFKSVEFFGLDNRDSNLYIHYNFKLPDYVKVAGEQIFVNLNLEKDLRSANIDIKKRKGIPIDNDYKYEERESNTLLIPKGFEVNYLPGNTSFKNDLFGFNITYEKTADKVVMVKDFYINYLLLKEDKFLDFNAMIKEINKAYSEVVVLQKITKPIKK
jgi:hypothetical protein